MTDPLDLLHHLVIVARATIAPPPRCTVSFETATALAGEIRTERGVPRELPRVIGEEALLLATTLCLVIGEREDGRLVRASQWASIASEMLDLVLLTAQEAGAPAHEN